MKRYKINGGYYLSGDIFISGSKNASLPIICASIILRRKVELYNVPDISDVNTLLEILKDYNVEVTKEKDYLIIDSSNIKYIEKNNEKVKNFRASYYLLGSCINVFDSITLFKQGGCKLGERPVDLHSYAFSRLGLRLEETEDKYRLFKERKSKKKIKFKKVSMGATINAILASLSVNKKIVIQNVSLEPEVLDLIEFLNVCGYRIERYKNNVIVYAERALKEHIKYTIMYDRIEAGSYAILAGLVGNGIQIHNFKKEHLKSLLCEFDAMGIKYNFDDDVLYIPRNKMVNSVNIVADVYPKFPTDLMQMMTILSLKSGDVSTFKDNIYPTRYAQLSELSKYGVDVMFDRDELLILGNNHFDSGIFVGNDLRGTMSLILYALNCDGESYVYGVEYVERGYSDIVNKLINIGACIEVETIEE